MNGAFYQYEEKDSSSNTQKIPRPPNAFMMFAREYRPVLLNKTPNVENKFISIKLGQMWKSMTAQQKAKYFYMAKLAEQRHRQMYPDYRYVPKRKKVAEEPVRNVNFAYIAGSANGGNQGPYSLSRKLDAISKTVCDTRSANPVSYVKQPGADGFGNQMCLTPQQQVIMNNGQAFQPVISSAFQQYPAKQVSIYQDVNGQAIAQPVIMNQVYCDSTGKCDLQTLGDESAMPQDAAGNIHLQKAQNRNVTDTDNLQPLKKVQLRNMNDPETTIEVFSENSLNDGVYFVQSELAQQQDTLIAKDFKNDEMYVKVADKTYADISNNTVQPAQPPKETNLDVLNQWIQFFQSVMPGEKFMKDTLACPCLAFLSCNEEFALKMGWKPGEMTSFQNFVKSRLSSIVGENGITGPCTTSPVNCAQQEAAAPVTKEETSSDTSASDSSSALEDTSSNSMNTFSFPDTPSNITCGANDSTEGN